MSRFLTPLDMRLMRDVAGKPITNRDGRQLYELLANLAYLSDVADRIITVRAGFVTDLASVPRYPLIYDAVGDIAQDPAVVHDYLYSTGATSREMADEVFLEAMSITGVPAWRRYAMYWAVRMFGGQGFAKPEPAG